MKSQNIESLYASLNKQIRLAQSYMEIDSLGFLIKACRLKPHDYMLNRSENIVLYKQWADEFGNSLNLIKNRKTKITIGDLSIKTPPLCTDLYYGLSIFKISKMSKLIFLSIGKDEDTQEDCCMITFLGLDNYLRTYMYIYDEWQQVSPLMLGISNLIAIAKNLDLKYFCKLTKKENCALPCSASQTWLSFMPASKVFTQLIKQECNYILPLLTKDY